MNEWHNAKEGLPPKGIPVMVESELGHHTTCWITDCGDWAGNLSPLKWKYLSNKNIMEDKE